MNRIYLCLTAVFVCAIILSAFGQKPHYVYIQTENNIPFFVQVNKKTYSSSSVGHLILSGVTSGTYEIKLGFPGQNILQDYLIEVDQKDCGFVVKKIEETGDYGLVDVLTEKVQMNGALKKEAEEALKQKELAAAEARKLEEEKTAREIKRLEEEKAAIEAKRLADEKAAAEAVQREAEKAGTALLTAGTTSSVNTGNHIASEKAKSSDAASLATNEGKRLLDSSAGSTQVVARAAEASATSTAVFASGENKERADNSNSEMKSHPAGSARNLAESGQTNVQPNTPANAGAPVSLLSAAEIARLQEEARKIDAKGKRDSALAAEKAKSADNKPSAIFLDMEMTMPESTKPVNSDSVAVPAILASVPVQDSLVIKVSPDTVVVTRGVQAVSITKDTALTATNPNCKAEVSNSELELIIMIIKGERDPEEAINIIKKTVKVKCVTTAQVRTLALLFELDEHRYASLDIAYKYTIDRQNYSILSDLLKDSYYVNRFKAMLQ